MTDPVVEIPFSGGIDQYTRDELVDASAAFTRLENVRQTQRGGAEKRYGYKSIGATRIDGTTRTIGRRLLANGAQTCTIDDERIDVYVPSLQEFVPRSLVPEAGYRPIDLPSFGTSVVVSDTIATGTGFAVVAQLAPVTGGGWKVWASLVDIATGAIVRGPEATVQATRVGQVCLATYGTSNAKVAVLYGVHDVGFEQVEWAVLDTTSATTIEAGWVGKTAIALAGTTGQLVAAVCPSHPDRFVIAADYVSGSDHVFVATVNDSGVVNSASITTSAPTAGTLDIVEQGSTLWVIWGVGVNIFAQAFDPGTMSVTVAQASVVVDTGTIENAWVVERPAGAGCLVFSYGNSFQLQNVASFAGVAAPDGVSQVMGNAILCGRPFLRNDRVYAWASSETRDDLALYEFVVPVSADTVPQYARPVCAPVARGLVDETRFTDRRCRTAPLDTLNPARRYLWAWPSKRTGLSDGIAGAILDFYDFEAYSSAPHRGGSLAIGGGVTSIFDGAQCFESNFLSRPPDTLADTSVAGSQTFTLGGRNYVAVYSHSDANGNLHQSGVSKPQSSGNCTSKKVLVSVRGINLTARQKGDVEVWLYGTADGGAAPYTFVGRAANVTDVQVVIEDTRVEADVPSFALLYGTGNLPETNGASQDHRAPPGLYSLTSYNGMLCGISGAEVWYCSQPVYGEGAWWSPVFTQQFDENLTGLFVMDGTLYATSERSIYPLSGTPINDEGTEGGLSAPSKLAIDRGCISSRSIVVTSQGALFRSDHGIELFRAGAMQPIGDLVRDTLATYPIVTSAVFDATRGLVRFSLAAALASDGTVQPNVEGNIGGVDLVFDIVRAVWISVDRKHGTGDDDPSQDAAIVVDGGVPRYAWLAGSGEVYIEDPTTKRDHGSAWISQLAETGWVHIAGLQGEQFIDHLLLLAERVSDHALSISIAYDYGDYGTPKVFNATTINALAREWLDREVSQTTSQAIRVLLQDAADDTLTTGNGEGAIWVALTFSGQRHGGAKRTSGAQRGE